MRNVEIDSSVFNEAYIPYIKDNTPTQIFYGGASSGKSVFLAQRAVYDLMQGGRNYLICREVARTLRGSVVMEISKVINSWGVNELFSINKTDSVITCQNGYQIVFVGLDDVEKLKSITPLNGVFTDAFCEEATETDKASIMQILKRQRGGSESVPKRMTLSFNPILRTSWIYQDYFKNIVWDGRSYKTDEISILKTTYKDNRFLTKQDVYRLEHETDKYRYDVYTLGEWGVLGNVIFTNWTVQDLSSMRDQFTNHRHGGDFGFSDDPAAIVVSHYDKPHKTIYIYDELYQSGLTNDLLAVETKKLIGDQVIVWDSAEPKSIEELKRHGVYAIGAKKGKDSVLHGTQWLQQQSIIVDTKCINSRNELQGWKWREDKGGNALPEPIGVNDHLMAALRYGYERESEDIGNDLLGWA
jgi:phage terminase large subunit